MSYRAGHHEPKETEAISPSYKVALRSNATGEVRFVSQDLPWIESSHYWWTGGNMGCDCNRANEFFDSPDCDDACGHIRFTALYAEFPDGSRIELDEVPA